MKAKKRNKPMSLIEFNKKFDTEEKCREYMFKMRYPNGYVCPKCGHTEYYDIKTRHKYKCKKCHHQSSVTSGTIMDRTHLKLNIWLYAMYLFTLDKRGCSAMYLMKMLGVKYHTAWYLLQRLRTAMKNREEKYMLENIVELDDFYVGAPTKGGKRGRGTKKMKIIGAVSKDDEGKPKHMKMKCVSDLKGVTIGKFAKENIKEGSKIESDASQSYKKPLADKYMHVYEVFDADKEMLTWLHTMISNFKAEVLGTYHGLCKKHIGLYLAEFCYRFNRRYFSNMFERLAVAAVNAPILRYKSLVF